MTPERDLILCPCCKGAGRIELTGPAADTLALVRSLGREVTGAELGAMIGIQATAANNRLAWLESKALLFSRRYGRRRLYRATLEMPS